jgi:hypothetical protein
LDVWADVDAAVLAVLRYALLRMRATRSRGSGDGASVAPVLVAPEQLKLLRDTYVQPLADAVAAAQAEMRAEVGISALLPHPRPFPHQPPTPRALSSVAATAGTAGGGVGAASLAAAESTATRDHAAGCAPPAGAADAALSKLFLLDAAISAVAELLHELKL